MDGSVGSLRWLNQSADTELAEAARDAVRQWRYRPAMLNGNPVEIVTTVTARFRLEP
jgi:TonB family protein